MASTAIQIPNRNNEGRGRQFFFIRGSEHQREFINTFVLGRSMTRGEGRDNFAAFGF